MDRTFRKNPIKLFMASALMFGVVFAGTDEEFFLRGNQYYEQKDYDNAFDSYNMINKKGRAVLYNMGNVCFHTQDYAQALVYWSRAQINAPFYEYNIIERNKEHVYVIMGKSIEQSFMLMIIKFFNNILSFLPLLFLQLFFLIFWYLVLFVVLMNYRKIKKMIQISVIFFMIFSGALLGVYYTNQCVQNGVIVKKNAQLFTAPDKSFHKLCLLSYADNVKVKEIREGWYKIRYADMIGWIEADVVQII